MCEKHRKIANVSTCYDDLRYEKITLTHTQSYLKHFDLFAFYFSLHVFLFKQIMNEHIRDRKEIPNYVKLLTFRFYYAEAHKCH